MKMNFFKGISALAAVLLAITACDKEKRAAGSIAGGRGETC